MMLTYGRALDLQSYNLFLLAQNVGTVPKKLKLLLGREGLFEVDGGMKAADYLIIVSK